jgi:hypothetical protein
MHTREPDEGCVGYRNQLTRLYSTIAKSPALQIGRARFYCCSLAWDQNFREHAGAIVCSSEVNLLDT